MQTLRQMHITTYSHARTTSVLYAFGNQVANEGTDSDSIFDFLRTSFWHSLLNLYWWWNFLFDMGLLIWAFLWDLRLKT